MPNVELENHALRQAAREAEGSLREAVKQLNACLDDAIMRSEAASEASAAMEIAVANIETALRQLASDPDAPAKKTPRERTLPGGPTRQQGQFLAYIRDYTMRNQAGVAPTHAALQQFFDLTPPSVNSMLKRLESRGFIRRIPRQARAIELTIDPALIPPLDCPFKS